MRHYKAFTTVLILMSLLWVSNATAMESAEEDDQGRFIALSVRYSPTDLIEMGNQYITFMKEVGCSDTPLTQEEVDKLFTPQCSKIVNTKEELTSSRMLLEQLTKAREGVGKWTMDDITILPNPYLDFCAVEFTRKSEKKPKKHAVKTDLYAVRKDKEEVKGLKINQIKEVYDTRGETLGIQKPDGKEAE